MKKVIIALSIVAIIAAMGCTVKVKVANGLPSNAIKAIMVTPNTKTPKTDAVDIAVGGEEEIKGKAGPSSSKTSFYITWNGKDGSSTSSWVTNNGGFYLGSSTAWLSSKDVKKVSITYTGSTGNIGYDTYTTE